MAKITAIIDIGSNSLTMVIYEKTSRFAFHLIEKTRSKVRIGEGAYENGGVLQEIPMQRAYDTISDFINIAKSCKCRKILCVATSALRDAPNKSIFLNRVKKELNIHIKIIDGNKEGYFGAIAAINLLPKFQEATTIDIGGGSTEIAKIKNGKVVDIISLDLGTVRLKELFFDKKKEYKEVEKFIENKIQMIPKSFYSDLIIGIGGSIRAISCSIMKKQNHPIKSLHGFEYKVNNYYDYIQSISNTPVLQLKKLYISKSRIDTIREGSIIFSTLLKKLGAKNILTSKVGVREGVYLSDVLRSSNHLFPINFNISIKSLTDRFAINEKNSNYLRKITLMIFDTLKEHFELEQMYKSELAHAAKLHDIIKRMNIYSNGDYDFYFLLENLNFAHSHKEKLLIAMLTKYANKGEINPKEFKKYKSLLPSFEQLEWLCFILSLANCINQNKTNQDVKLRYENSTLYIETNRKIYLSYECIKKLSKPAPIAIKIVFQS